MHLLMPRLLPENIMCIRQCCQVFFLSPLFYHLVLVQNRSPLKILFGHLAVYTTRTSIVRVFPVQCRFTYCYTLYPLYIFLSLLGVPTINFLFIGNIIFLNKSAFDFRAAIFETQMPSSKLCVFFVPRETLLQTGALFAFIENDFGR